MSTVKKYIKGEVESFKRDREEQDSFSNAVTLMNSNITVSTDAKFSELESLKSMINVQLKSFSEKLHSGQRRISHWNEKIEAINNSDILKVWGDKVVHALKIKELKNRIGSSISQPLVVSMLQAEIIFGL